MPVPVTNSMNSIVRVRRSQNCSFPTTILLSLVLVLLGCGNPQESARKELVKLGKDYSPDVFAKCIENGDKMAVKLFLDSGIDVNQPGPDGSTALMTATMKGDADLVQVLLAKGANVNAKTDKGQAPLDVGLISGNDQVVKLLVAKGADVNAKGTADMTPLMTAAFGGRSEMVRLLLANGADIYAKDEKGLTAVDYARGQTNQDVLKALWERGAPFVTDTELTRLLDQFRNNLGSVAVSSMDKGETPDACRKLIAERLARFKDQEQFTTNQLLEARVCAFKAVCSAIQGFALRTVTSEIDSARRRAEPFMEFRKELQTDKQVQAQLLCAAAMENDTGMAKWLLEQGADVNARSETGFTPLMFAATKGSDTTAQVLLEAGADVNLKGYLGMTAVMDAAAFGKTKILAMLLAAKADANASNDKGQTALLMAKAKNFGEAVTLLEAAGAKE